MTTIGIGVGAFIAGVILADKVKAGLSSLKDKVLAKAKDEVKKVL